MRRSTISLDFTLHTYCNMNCSFCFEDKGNGISIKDNRIDLERIRSLPEKAIHAIRDKLKYITDDTVEILIYGGELFADELPDSLFDEYRNFLERMMQLIWAERPDLRIIPVVITNGIYENYDRVDRFIYDNHCVVELSYDACGRFQCDRERERWLMSLNHFIGKFPLFISISNKKPDIDAYIRGDKYFEYIPKTIGIEISEYVPNLNYQEYLPSDDDIYNFYKWCIDTGHFNVSSVGELFSEKRTPCNPLTEFLFFPNLPDQQEWMYLCNMCAPFSKEEYYGEYRKCMCANCPDAIDTARSHKRGCVYCEYNGNCVKMCTLPYMFSKYKMNDVCPIFQILKYIESDDSIIKRYHSWKEEFDRFNDQFSYGDIYEKHVL